MPRLPKPTGIPESPLFHHNAPSFLAKPSIGKIGLHFQKTYVTFRLSLGVSSIFLLLWLTFFFLAAGDFGYLIGSVGCATIGGYVGILTGVDALLVAFVEILNATASRIIIPLGRPIFRN